MVKNKYEASNDGVTWCEVLGPGDLEKSAWKYHRTTKWLVSDIEESQEKIKKLTEQLMDVNADFDKLRKENARVVSELSSTRAYMVQQCYQQGGNVTVPRWLDLSGGKDLVEAVLELHTLTSAVHFCVSSKDFLEYGWQGIACKVHLPTGYGMVNHTRLCPPGALWALPSPEECEMSANNASEVAKLRREIADMKNCIARATNALNGKR